MIRFSVYIFIAWIITFPIAAQFSSNIPVILIDTKGQDIVDEERIVAYMQVIDNEDGARNSLDSLDSLNFSFEGRISIEIRGTTSQGFPKKQYALETQYASGSNLNVSLIGMPAENDWILYAPYSDKTLIRNALAYQLFRELGHYSPRTRFCELFLNGEYQGVYVLTEKIKRDSHRLDIAEMETSDNTGDALSGGYIYKIDRANPECQPWMTALGDYPIHCVYPECEQITPQQLEYSTQVINEFEQALFADKFMDPLKGYRSLIDLNSFLDFMYVNEVAKNIDAYRLSTYLYKDRDSREGKLTMGPVWDFNLGFGNANYRNGQSVDSLLALQSSWWKRLFEDPYFKQTASKRWNEQRKGPLSNERINAIIDSMAFLLAEAQERNFEKWEILGEYVWPNYYVGETYENEIDYMKTWIMYRIDWLDQHFEYKYPPIMITNSSLYIFTNPITHYLSVEFNIEQDADISFIFYDMMGNIQGHILPAYYEAGTHRRTYRVGGNELPDLRKGLYVLMMYVDGIPVTTKKIMRY